jgi:hypothetical protein
VISVSHPESARLVFRRIGAHFPVLSAESHQYSTKAYRYASVVLILWKELGLLYKESASSCLVCQVIGSLISLPYSKAVTVSNVRELTALRLIALLPRCRASPTTCTMSPFSGFHATRLRRPMDAISQHLACASSAPRRSSTAD